MSIYTKLHKIQKEVKGLSKDKKSHNFEYVTGNKLLSFVRPLMDKYGLLLKQEVLDIENERMDYKTKYAEKSEILSKVMMRFTWIDIETGERDENLFGANGQNDWEKGLGSALTYAERYFLLKYFHIATDEDDIDNPDRKLIEKEIPKKPEPKKELKTIQKSKLEDSLLNGSIEELRSLFKEYNLSKEEQEQITERAKFLKTEIKNK